MPFAEVAKNQALDGITVDLMQMHSGDPGAAGANNQLGTKVACTFAAAGSSARALSTAVDFTGLGASQSCPWFSIWLNAGTVFKGRGQITSGDVAANAAGEFRVTTATSLTLSDS